MEDRYLFRGKRIDNGEWIVGDLIQNKFLRGMRSWISSEKYDPKRLRKISKNMAQWRSVEVDPSTICQCTGLKGKNGNLIWENDIVKDLFSDTAAPIRYGSYQSCFDSTKVEHIGFYVDWSGKYNKNYRKDLGYWIHMVDAEIIGNVFDGGFNGKNSKKD